MKRDTDKYEYLKEIDEIIEHFEIANMINERMKKYNPKNNISWETLKDVYNTKKSN